MDSSVLSKMGLKFLFGLSVYIGKWVIRFPINVPPVFYTLAFFGIVLKIILNYNNIALVIDCSHMIIHVVVGLQTYHIMRNREKVLRLVAFLDKFDGYPELRSESTEIKNKFEKYIVGLYNVFSRCILVAINMYTLFPVYKLFTEDGRANLTKVLVWPMWMGVPEKTWWGFAIVFTTELFVAMFLLLSVMYVVPFLASMGAMASAQCQFLCVCIRLYYLFARTMERRAITTARAVEHISFEQALIHEMDAAAHRLQLLKRACNELADVFKYYLSSFYYGGVLSLCMSGILAVTASEEKENSLKFLCILFGELVSITLATYVSESIRDGFAGISSTLYDLGWYNFSPRCRKRLNLMITTSTSKGLHTFIGYELTLLHFADMLNASYKYYNALLRIRN